MNEEKSLKYELLDMKLVFEKVESKCGVKIRVDEEEVIGRGYGVDGQDGAISALCSAIVKVCDLEGALHSYVVEFGGVGSKVHLEWVDDEGKVWDVDMEDIDMLKAFGRGIVRIANVLDKKKDYDKGCARKSFVNDLINN